MPDYLIYFFLTIILGVLIILYFRIASQYNIIDHPNKRSSHSKVTIRGGGIIFPVAVILYFVIYNFHYPYFLLGLILISLISFLDDLHTLNNKIRLVVHLIAVALLIYQWNLHSMPWYWLIAATIFVIGTINACNFMDGINGLTGLYSLSIISSLMFLNASLHFIDQDFLMVVTISLFIFLYFNFRRTAVCFAGDVGSISIAFIVLFAIGNLILLTHQIIYILFLAVYGTDSVLTIIMRIRNKENIFQPHRSHLYQLLGNERGFMQRGVAVSYAVLQILINILIIWAVKQNIVDQFAIVIILLLLLSFSYYLIRYFINRRTLNLKG